MTIALNYFDATASLWKTYVGTSFQPDPIKAFDTATGQLTVSSTSTTYAPYTEIELQVVYTSVYVKLDNPVRSVTDEFKLIVKASCNDNTLTLGTPLSDVEYYLGEGNRNFQIAYTTSIATNACPLSASLYILNDSTQAFDLYTAEAYVVGSSFLTTNTGANLDAGFFTINQASKTGY
jgi:hypothetical protein